MVTWRQRYYLKKWLASSTGLVPLGFIFGAIGMSFLLPWIDKQIGVESPYIYSASSALSTLSAIAAGMITFTGFVFSTLTFAMQFESTTYTTRLMRMISSNNLSKTALGVFVATFLYALLVLSRVIQTSNSESVPQYSVLFSVLLVIMSVLLFLRLITVVTHLLRTGQIVAVVGERGRKMIENAYPHRAVSPEISAGNRCPDPATAQKLVNTGKGGVLQAVDLEGIVDIAEKAGAMIELVPAVGDYVSKGDVVFHVYEKEHPVNERVLLNSIALGYERTFQHDLLYPLRILVDIAIRALSPAVNDPTTAVQTMDQIADLILMLASRQLTAGIFKDSQGTVRFIYRSPTWEEYLSLAMTEIRIYGAGSPRISKCLESILIRAKAIVPKWRIPAIDEQLKLLQDATALR